MIYFIIGAAVIIVFILFVGFIGWLSHRIMDNEISDLFDDFWDNFANGIIVLFFLIMGIPIYLLVGLFGKLIFNLF